MNRKVGIALALIGALVLIFAGVVLVPNPAGNRLITEAKANGYIAYKPMEAYTLARRICTQCHSDERIKRYCERCGPPFIAVIPHMQTFIENFRVSKPGLKVENITEHQGAVIVQVWNAIVGNWEKDFRPEDIYKMVGNYPVLKELYVTPIEKRPIESALMGREDLKIGYMADMEKTMKNPEPAAQDVATDPAKHDHAGHDHSQHMKETGGQPAPAREGAQDHSKHDHSQHTEHK